jgi:hypothetical protein
MKKEEVSVCALNKPNNTEHVDVVSNKSFGGGI